MRYVLVLVLIQYFITVYVEHCVMKWISWYVYGMLPTCVSEGTERSVPANEN